MSEGKLGTPVDAGPKKWVQTERAAHEAWGRLALKSPIAAAVLHRLVAIMGHQNAVVIGQKTLAKLLGCNPRSIARAIGVLESERWIQVVQIGQRGTVNAYVVNDQVAWGEKREHLPRLSVFSATIVADEEDQPEYTLLPGSLRRIPALYPGEAQLPTGAGEEPPSQPALPGMEHDLPVIQAVSEKQ